MKVLEEIYKILDEKKGTDLVVLNIEKITSIAEYFVIVTAENVSKMSTLEISVKEGLEKIGVSPLRIEGEKKGNWILMDYGDIVVHIFSEEGREYYGLERIWKDAKIVEF